MEKNNLPFSFLNKEIQFFQQIVASSIAFYNIFQNLQVFPIFCKTFCKIWHKILTNFKTHDLQNSHKFCRFFANVSQKFAKFACEKIIFL